MRLAREHEIEMPIAKEVYEMLFEDKDPGKALQDLMGRSQKTEEWC